MKRCPKCGSKSFLVLAHITQEWLVDEKECFERCWQECVDITHRPDDEDIWTCFCCSYEAPGSEFNIKE